MRAFSSPARADSSVPRICRALAARGFKRVLAPPRSELDLRDRAAVDRFFAAERPEYVFLAAAKVGGIVANDTYPADFIRDNLEIQTNVIDAAYRAGTRKLCFLGSSCIYPRLAPQPLHESSLLTGPLEPTNQWYAIAKIAGIKMCQAYAPPIRVQRDLRHADEPLWPRRQLRPADLSRACRR